MIPMNYITDSGDASINLQATLSASSAMPIPSGVTPPIPHHPIVCGGALSYDENNYFACEHIGVGPGDIRTQLCIDHSIALLLIEEARKL